MGCNLRMAAGLMSAALAAAQTNFTANRLRVEYLADAITIDVPQPKFSYALDHPVRGQYQTAYQLVVASAAGSTVWDSGKVMSNRTLNIVYNGTSLVSDSDYTWTVTSWDSTGASSVPTTSFFSTALFNTPADFNGAAWLTSGEQDGSMNTYRSANIVLAAPVTRARLYIAGMGYAKTWVNGQLTDDHELGTFTTFEKRVLYDVVDVTALMFQGCNTLGVMVGHGWFAQPSVNSGPRQFLAMLSVTTADGATTYYPSAASASSPSMVSASAGGALRAGASIVPLTFTATAGPVTQDDIYVGENYDGRVAASLAGWSTCEYKPQLSTNWTAPVVAAKSPASFNSIISSHNVAIRTDQDYAVVPGGPYSPGPGQYVYDFGQNMAGQVTLTVHDCPEGTVIVMRHGEILYPNGSVHNHYLPGAPMMGVYTCSGMEATETYRYLFTYMGFRYVQLEGYPGVPGEDALKAHFIHSDVPQTGEFSSSSDLLNSIQHATRYASWSNLMDIPTDCPQRERRGWLGDAQLSFETVIHNIDGGAFYTKWIKDFVDTQVYDNATMNAQGAMPDCIPFYGHGHTESDPGWGIAAWNIPDWFGQYYADDSFEAAYYPYLRWYMEHWVSLAAATPTGLFPIAWWGDWAEYYPGPYGHQTADYADFFYLSGLIKTLGFATRLGIQADVQRYTTLLTAAQALYLKTYYNATTHCFVDCMYVSQIFGLSLGLFQEGSADEAAVWNNAVQWFTANGTHAEFPGIDTFGGGIIALKLVYPLLDRFGMSGLGLRWQLQDTVPSFGHWITSVGATTLLEAWDLTPTSGAASYNHIMFGGSGSWYYQTLGGLKRADNSRSWSNLVIAPPSRASQILANLSWAAASIDTPMGLASSSWTVVFDGSNGMCGYVPENSVLNLTCAGGGAFTGVKFASFGTPSGDCNRGFAIDAACNSNNSVPDVTAACVGKNSCTVPATNTFFGGDPCLDTVKALAIQMEGNCVISTPVYALQTTIPVNGVASVILPTVNAAANATITEGSTVVWTAGAYVPGAVGISGAVAGADGVSVVFTVGSGSYSFVASA